jgi:hypothetical protein
MYSRHEVVANADGARSVFGRGAARSCQSQAGRRFARMMAARGWRGIPHKTLSLG